MPRKSPYPDFQIPEVSLSDFIFSQIKNYGNDIAMVDCTLEQNLTYREILNKSLKCAKELRKLGVKKDDVVGICADNCLEYIIVIMATMATGAIITTFKEDQFIQHSNLSQPKIVFVHKHILEKIETAMDKQQFTKTLIVIGESDQFQSFNSLVDSTDEEDFSLDTVEVDAKKDVVFLPYSSGTTGASKCVEHTHYSCIARILMGSSHTHFLRGSCYYSDRPMYHGACVHSLLICLYTGTKIVFEHVFDPERMLKAIDTHKVTHALLVPPVMLVLSQCELWSQYDVSSIKFLICGGSNVSTDVLDFLQKRFDSIVLEGYGLTEGTISYPDPVNNRRGSAGIIFPNTSVKIVDLQTGDELGENQNGEILAKGPQMAIGYYNNPEATSLAFDNDGWVHTGDVGRYDKDGMLYIVGRIKELIHYKSYKIHPGAIELFLLKHPSIADAAVIGVPDSKTGEKFKAFIVKKKGFSLDENGVKSFVEKNLQPQNYLEGGVQFVDAIRKTATGKILRNEMKKLHI